MRGSPESLGSWADAYDAAGIPALRMWGSVPSYVSAPPSPKATLAIIRELEGEKVDILKYEIDSKRFIRNALSPAVGRRRD